MAIEVVRHFGVPHTIDTVICHAPNGASRTHAIEPTLLVAGASLEVDFDRGKKVK